MRGREREREREGEIVERQTIYLSDSLLKTNDVNKMVSHIPKFYTVR